MNVDFSTIYSPQNHADRSRTYPALPALSGKGFRTDRTGKSGGGVLGEIKSKWNRELSLGDTVYWDPLRSDSADNKFKVISCSIFINPGIWLLVTENQDAMKFLLFQHVLFWWPCLFSQHSETSLLSCGSC